MSHSRARLDQPSYPPQSNEHFQEQLESAITYRIMCCMQDMQVVLQVVSGGGFRNVFRGEFRGKLREIVAGFMNVCVVLCCVVSRCVRAIENTRDNVSEWNVVNVSTYHTIIVGT